MKSYKVLVLVHQDCVPPERATIKLADWAHWKTEFYVIRTLKKLGHQVDVFPVTDELNDLKQRVDQSKPQIVFNLLEEFQGNPQFESHVVSFLELLGVSYTGCNPQGLAIGRDKALTKMILNHQGIDTPDFFTVDRGKKMSIPATMKYPMIVKSLSEEASLGISQDSIVHNPKKLTERVRFIHQSLGTAALVEEYIKGRELYIGVMGHSNLKVFKPWELSFGNLKESSYPIATRTVKFNRNYCEKYSIQRGLAKGIDPWLGRKINNLCRSAYKSLKMSGYARMDLRLTEDQQVYFLEVNPNPELADKECLANAARYSGHSYDQLISKILSLSLSYKKAVKVSANF